MKKNVLLTIIYLLFLVVFNLIFYVMGGTEHPMSVWIFYIFIHVAYVLLAFTSFFVRKGSNEALFGMTLDAISGTYFTIELVVGAAFILLSPESFKLALILQIILAAGYLVLLFTNVLANDKTADAVERHELEVQYLKEAAMILKEVISKVEDKTANKKVERVLDLIQSSPAKSRSNVAGLEMQIVGELETLRNIAMTGTAEEISLCADRIYSMASERNRQLKLSN